MVQKAVEDKFEQRLFLVQRQIMSLNFLSSIAKEFDLYPEAREKEMRMPLCSCWRERLKSSGSRWTPRLAFSGVEAFTVSFMHPDPEPQCK